MNLNQAINCIDAKDLDRALNISSSRLDSMFRAITDERKLVGRALAVFLINKFNKITSIAGKTYNEYYSRISTLRDLLGDRLDNSAYDRLSDMSDREFARLVVSTLDQKVPWKSETFELRRDANYRNLLSDSNNDNNASTANRYTGFFANESIDEDLEIEPEINIEGNVYNNYYFGKHPSCLSCGVNEEGELFFGDAESGYNLPDTDENREFIVLDWLDETGEDIFEEALGDTDEEILDVENIIDETYSEAELKNLVGKVYNLQKIENIYRRKKYNDKKLFAHTVCTQCGREKRVFLSNLVNDPDKYGSCICSDTNIDSKIDNISKLYTNQKKLSSNTSGYTGVSFVKTYAGQPYNKWRAYIEVDGTRIYLGDFTSKAKAIKARKEAGEKGVKWYKENRNKLMKDVRKKTKKYTTSKYRETKKQKVNITAPHEKDN